MNGNSSKVSKTLRHLSLVVGVVSVLAIGGCGGGGGGSSSSSAPDPSVALTSSNAEQVTAAALAQFLGGSSLDAVPFSATAQTTSRSGRTTTPTELAEKAASLIQTSSRVSAATTLTSNCAINGNVTIDSADGTSGTITFNNCEDVAGEILNGFISFSNYSESGTTISFTASFNLTFSVSGQPDLVLSGGFNANEDTATSTTTITGTSYTGTFGAETFGLFSFTFVETEDTGTGFATTSASFTLSGTFINGAVTVTTLVPFQTNTGAIYPYTGEMEIVGVNNSRIHVKVLGDETFVGDQVQIDVDADGDSVFETTIMTTWATIESL